jgi:hypothetical protein
MAQALWKHSPRPFQPLRLVSSLRREILGMPAGSQRAQIIAYLDDDCYPAADYLDAVVECLLRPQISDS